MTHHRIVGVSMILCSTCFEAIGQFTFKRAADTRPAGSGPIAAALSNYRWVLFGWFSFIIEGLFWSAALYFLDVTVAHPIGSIVFVVVAVLARLFLHERISPRRWLGITLILAGTVLVAFN
ncbi:MAG TPA: EamA family transporter [Tepidisphaeraceae bacterium]|nr:EamA family transporter [Tepidisphaeraceae bacterium]